MTFFLFIFTVPTFSPDYHAGLDSSYVWALNHFFHNDFQFLKTIIYPIGPLGFLKHPIVIGHNFLISISFFFILKTLFIYGFITIILKLKGKLKLYDALLLLICSIFLNFDTTIIGVIICSLIYFEISEKWIFAALPFLLAVCALLIKLSLGINAIAVCLAFILFYFLRNRNRNFKFSIILMLLLTIVFFLFNLSFFTNTTDFKNYYINSLNLVSGYGVALVFHPKNNAVLLFIFTLTILYSLFLLKNKENKINYVWVLSPSLFLMFKHGFIRQDATHYGQLFYFLILFWSINVVLSNKKRALFISVISIWCIYANWKNVPYFYKIELPKPNIQNFYNTTFNYTSFVEFHKNKAQEQLSKSILPTQILSVIGSNTVDVFPWSLGLIAANRELNWSPRPTLQSGAFSSWYDEIESNHFESKNAPQFLIWHLFSDSTVSKFTSLDRRYIFNDEPKLTKTLLNNYNCVYRDRSYILLQRNSEKFDNLMLINKSVKTTLKWNQWQEVTIYDSLITTVNIDFISNLTNKIKKFLYKNDQYFIDYKTDEGVILSYRFVAENAQDGLFLNPVIKSLQPYNTPKIKSFRLRTNGEINQYSDIDIQFVNYYLNRKINHYFMESFNGTSTLKLKELLNEEQSINKNEFSKSINIKYTNQKFNKALINFAYLTSLNKRIEPKIIFEVKNKKGDTVYWKSKTPYNWYFNFYDWNYVLFDFDISSHQFLEGYELKAYVWNHGELIKIKEFSLFLF